MLNDEFYMECYICTDKCDTLSPCTCEQLYLHQDCYAKLLAYDHKKCTVCNTPFPLEIENQQENSIGSIDSMEDEDEHIPLQKPSKWWVFVPLYLRPSDVWVMYEADILIELFRTPIWLFGFMTLFSIAYEDPIWDNWYDMNAHMELYISAIVTMILVSTFVKSFCISNCCC